MYLRILCKIHAAGSIAQQPYVSQDPLQDPRLRTHVSASLYLTDSLQDPRLRIHVSASLYLRLLCKIHVSRSVCKHPYVSQDPLQDPCLRIHVSASICISGTSARSMSSDSCLSIFVSQDPLQDPCLRFMSQHLYISGSSARSMSPDSCLSIFISQDPLQDPCLRTQITASICISGSSARSMSPGSCLSIFASQDPRQDPCLRIHVSTSLYLRILCKIHVSDSCLSIHQNRSSRRSTSSDSCLSIFISHGFSARPMSPDPCRSIHLYLRILDKIHVFGLMSQHLRISGSSARSMRPIHVLASTKMDPLEDPCLQIHVSASLYLRILCKIHVSGSR